MATILTTNVGQTTLNPSTNYYVPEGEILSHTGNTLVFADGSNVTLTVAGIIFSDGDAINTNINGTGESLKITVTATGQVIGDSDGIEMFRPTSVITNHGMITAYGDAGVQFGSSSTNSRLENFGTISSVLYAAYIEADDVAVFNAGTLIGTHGINFDGANGTILNTGNIVGTAATTNFTFADLGLSIGVRLGNSSGMSIDNSGLISGLDYSIFTTTSSGGIALTNTGEIFGYMVLSNASLSGDDVQNGGTIDGLINLRGGTDTLSNTGTITGNITGSTGTKTITNFGMIDGDIDIATVAANRVDNSGTITGTIALGNGTNSYTGTAPSILGGDLIGGASEDTIVNAGYVAGDVVLNDGNDLYTAIGSGTVAGIIDGGAGNDTITGGSNADFIDGGDDNDRLFGRGGDDDLRGGLGSDFMSAGAGDDFMLGDNGADRMFGGGGEDTLQGGRDLDTIRGGDGDDEINGGRSADVLRGGAGADTFLYQFRQDSTLNLSDRIQDFEVGVDVIDISNLSGQFTFVGSAAFSGSGNEVRYEIGGNGKTFVEVDTDANGTADMRILLTAVGVLTEDDFVL